VQNDVVQVPNLQNCITKPSLIAETKQKHCKIPYLRFNNLYWAITVPIEKVYITQSRISLKECVFVNSALEIQCHIVKNTLRHTDLSAGCTSHLIYLYGHYFFAYLVLISRMSSYLIFPEICRQNYPTKVKSGTLRQWTSSFSHSPYNAVFDSNLN